MHCSFARQADPPDEDRPTEIPHTSRGSLAGLARRDQTPGHVSLPQLQYLERRRREVLSGVRSGDSSRCRPERPGAPRVVDLSSSRKYVQLQAFTPLPRARTGVLTRRGSVDARFPGDPPKSVVFRVMLDTPAPPDGFEAGSEFRTTAAPSKNRPKEASIRQGFRSAVTNCVGNEGGPCDEAN